MRADEAELPDETTTGVFVVVCRTTLDGIASCKRHLTSSAEARSIGI
jgi:hypothetical protein